MITIIGGGIGGLTLANALQHHVIPFRLYEQASELTEVGAGIGLSEAPIKIFDQLGLGNEVRANGAAIQKVFFSDKNLKVRREIETNSEMLCIHRARLIDILQKKLPSDAIHLSHTLSDIRIKNEKAELHFENRSPVEAACVVAADGIHSVVRKSLFPEISIRYINQVIWRGITDEPMPSGYEDSYIEIWDERLRFLTISIGHGQTLWIGAKPESPGGFDDPMTVRKKLLDLFKNFHPDLLKMIETSDNFLRNDMADLGAGKRKWHKGPVVFHGDAIHATTPNLAQGGCQAIEDAWCLAKCLKKYGNDHLTAFKIYSKLRKPKVMKIVKDSWLFGKAAHSGNPFLHYSFRLLLSKGPELILRRQENFLNNLNYLEKI